VACTTVTSNINSILVVVVVVVIIIIVVVIVVENNFSDRRCCPQHHFKLTVQESMIPWSCMRCSSLHFIRQRCEGIAKHRLPYSRPTRFSSPKRISSSRSKAHQLQRKRHGSAQDVKRWWWWSWCNEGRRLAFVYHEQSIDENRSSLLPRSKSDLQYSQKPTAPHHPIHPPVFRPQATGRSLLRFAKRTSSMPSAAAAAQE
jgi:hypothetical protein